MEHIAFLDRGTIAPQIRMPVPSFAHTMREFDRTAPDEVVERVRDATILIDNKVRLPAETLAELKHLRLIAMAATGTDCVDRKFCLEHGIAVLNVRGYAATSVAEHVMALILALQRNLLAYRKDVLSGAWQASGQFCFFNHPIAELKGKRLGIVGKGRLGESVAALARGIGMTVMFAARKGKDPDGLHTPWDEVLKTADALSLHCPLTPATRGLIAYREFQRMTKRPILINTARGGLVVEEDLERALEEDLISGAGIDVTMPEPPPPDSVIMRIAGRSNVIVTPHMAWASLEAQQVLVDRLFANIENFVAGRPTDLVTGEF